MLLQILSTKGKKSRVDRRQAPSCKPLPGNILHDVEMLTDVWKLFNAMWLTVSRVEQIP